MDLRTKEAKSLKKEEEERRQRLEETCFIVASKGMFLRLPDPPPDGNYIEMARMWRTVLDQALVDLLKGPNKTDYLTPVEYNKTVTWLDLDDEYFNSVCRLALLKPNFVFETFDKMLKEYT